MNLPPGTLLVIDDPVFPWPQDEGIWMGWMEGMGCWFPLKTKLLKDDLQGPDFRKPIMVVAQFPVSETEWPFTVRGCHPVKRWRKPTDAELEKAKHFYGI